MKYISEINKNGRIAVDDTILVKDVLASSGSHILDGFKPLFSAEAVEKLVSAGYGISGKANGGEFGLDLLGETSYYGEVSENGKLVTAAASLVANGEADAALSVDVNGMPRRGAAASGVCFIKPSYGTVSRYGVIACACSGEQIGVTAATAEKAAEILGIIAGHDDKDGTSLPEKSYSYSINEEISGKKVCIIKELFDSASDEVKANVLTFAKALESKGMSVEEISLPEAKLANTVWQILLSAETCNNLSKFDGVKYGYRTATFKNIDDIYVGTRTEGFSFLSKAVILYGSDVLSKGRYENCYDKAMRLRRVIFDNVKEILSSYDVILTPVMSKTAYEPYDLSESFNKVFEESAYSALANLTGIPALVTNGVQLMANSFMESTLLSISHAMKEVK